MVVILCVDADPDRPRLGGTRYDSPDRLTWKALPEMVDKVTTIRDDLAQRFDAKLRMTWFLRADIQIKRIYGDAGWSLKEFGKIWERVSAAGDELAWHPHAWRWSDSLKCWYNETLDSDYILESHNEGFDAFKETLGFSPLACRAGINFLNTRAMVNLDSLGIKTELSAHPGVALRYTNTRVGPATEEGFDWSGAPDEPYHPSRGDYQRPAVASNSLEILEIPITVWRRSPASLDYWRRLLPFSIRNGPRMVRPPIAGWFIPYIWGDSSRLQLGLSGLFSRQTSSPVHYASYMHPDDITEAHYRNMSRNLEYIIATARRRGVELEFLTASQAREALQSGQVKDSVR